MEMEKKRRDDEKDRNWEFEEILRKVNVFGYYNWRMLIVLTVIMICNSSYCVNYIFVVNEIKYRCNYEECDTKFEIKSTNTTFDEVCYRYEPYSNESTCKIEDYDMAQTVPCKDWVFEKEESFVADFGLACQEWKRVLVGTIHNVGYMVGLLVVGPASDKFGRKKMLVCLTVVGALIGIAKSFMTYYWIYIALEFLEAIFGDSYSPCYLLLVELAPIEYRILFICLTGLSDCLSGLLIAGTAWAIPNWRNAVRGIYAPGLIGVIAIFLIDESPRWLLSKGRKDEAIVILKKAAKMNKKTIDKNSLKSLSLENEKEETDRKGIINIIFSSRILIVRFLICLYLWNTCTFVSYGLLSNINDLPGNLYANNSILSCFDLVSSIIIYFLLTKYKRKKPIICGYILTAIVCITQPFLPKENAVLVIVFYVLGKFMNSCVFSSLYLFTSELFPTYARNTMHALCSSIGRIGSILATQTPLLTVYWESLPTVIFGGAACLAAILTMLIPDPSDEILPDSVQQAESLGKKKQIPI